MRKIIILLFTISIIGCISSCEEMDSIYEEFIVPNGLKYSQRPDSLKVFAGYNKLRLTWFKAKDPSIDHAYVYWNNYHDSLKVNVNQEGEIVKVDVDNLNEGTYTLHVKTFDKNGNSSIPAEVTGTSYGDYYVMGATDRTIESALRDMNKQGTITWNNKTTDLVYTEVRYETSSGEQKVARILPEETILKVPDIKPGKLFEYRSVFLPKNGIDSVAREWKLSDSPFSYKYPRGDWTVETRSGNHPWGDGGGGHPNLILDGNLNTGWHSSVGSPFPQCVVVDMKEKLEIDNVIIYPPGPANWRYLNHIDIYMSDAPIIPDAPQPSWGEPVVKTQYPGGSSFNIDFPTGSAGQYMVIVFPDSKPSPYISFMELEVYGY